MGKHLALLCIVIFGCMFNIAAQSLSMQQLKETVDFGSKSTSGFYKIGFAYTGYTDSIGQQYTNEQTGEAIDLWYDTGYQVEGGYRAILKYHLPDKKPVNILLQSLRACGFSYSKRYKHYIRRNGSYVYDIVHVDAAISNTVVLIIVIGKEVGPVPREHPAPSPDNQ